MAAGAALAAAEVQSAVEVAAGGVEGGNPVQAPVPAHTEHSAPTAVVAVADHRPKVARWERRDLSLDPG